MTKAKKAAKKPAKKTTKKAKTTAKKEAKKPEEPVEVAESEESDEAYFEALHGVLMELGEHIRTKKFKEKLNALKACM